MKIRTLAGATALALVAGMGQAQDLKFPIGEGAFNWQSLADFDAKYNLEGQTLTIFGPWRGEDLRAGRVPDHGPLGACRIDHRPARRRDRGRAGYRIGR